MKYGNVEALIHVMEAQEQEKQDQFLDAAQQEAGLTAQKLIEEGKQKVAHRQVKFQAELDAKKAQEITKINMREQQKVSLFKQELILEAMEQVKTYCENLSENEYLHLLAHHLKIHGGEPVIIVPTRYGEITQKKWGMQYEIEFSEKLSSGFILSYPEYDLNHDFAQLFQFKKQELLKRMMQLLFEDERL